MDPLTWWWYDLQGYARGWGLDEPTARAYATLAVWGWQLGIGVPVIVSGLRSAEKQAQMRERWDRGERDGIAARPAVDSAHVQGKAFDVRGGGRWGALANYLPGVRWGGNFADADPNHFDTRG